MVVAIVCGLIFLGAFAVIVVIAALFGVLGDPGPGDYINTIKY